MILFPSRERISANLNAPSYYVFTGQVGRLKTAHYPLPRLTLP